MKATLRRIVTGPSFLLCLLVPAPAPAQTAVEAWVQRYVGTGDRKVGPTAMAVDGDNNVIVTGRTYISGANCDYVTVKYSGAGELLWTRTYSGASNLADGAAAVVVDSNNDIIITGYSNGLNLPLGYYVEDYITIKYSRDGVPLWTNRYDSSGRDLPFGLVVDASNDVLVVGFSEVTAGSFGCATVKYSSDGVPLRTNRYTGFRYDMAGGRHWAVDSQGNLIVAGTTPGIGTWPDYLTVKISSGGALLWNRTYAGPGNEFDVPTGVAVDANDNVIVTGWSCATFANIYDYLTIKYSSTGATLWTQRYGAPEPSDDAANAVAVDSSGNVLVTGSTGTIKYSDGGVPIWTNRYYGGRAMAMDADGSVYLTKSSANNPNYPYDNDYATVRLSSAGQLLWSQRYGGPAGRDDNPGFMVLDHRNNVIVTGGSYSDSSSYDLVTVKYSTVMPPVLTGLPLTNGSFQLRVDDVFQAGRLVIEASDDLAAWEAIFTNTTPTNLVFHTDPSAGTHPHRFYRACQFP